ncbi:hypothetical protein AVEN_191549-1 [Araneus ventricosus]|uniref:Uncharacterized protein n=1 Tax=Araneus ventricosus TaxID=182803 RepID=A0A4Y2L0J6_ARAVE|nr:hypothetical protein AVEN_191549-1 [Araneus ventricosus]
MLSTGRAVLLVFLKQCGFLLFPTKVSFTRCEPEALAHPRIVTRSFIFFRPAEQLHFLKPRFPLDVLSNISQLHIWSAVHFSFTIKSCNSAIKLFPASISYDSFSPTMLNWRFLNFSSQPLLAWNSLLLPNLELKFPDIGTPFLNKPFVKNIVQFFIIRAFHSFPQFSLFAIGRSIKLFDFFRITSHIPDC